MEGRTSYVSFQTRRPSARADRTESDEADVFLDSRGSKGEADVVKNALVSGTSAVFGSTANIDKISNAPSTRVLQRDLDHDHEQSQDV